MEKKFSKIKLFFVLTFILLALTMVFSTSGATYTDESNTKWEFSVNADGSTATITGASLSKKTSEFNIPKTVSDGTNTYTVTAIGSNAFNKSAISKLVFGELTIPDTVKTINSGAFANTYIYDVVVIPESVTYIGSSAFENCDGIMEVVLPSGVSVIETNTFKNCFAISKINLDNIVSIKNSAFYNCPALYDIEFSNKLLSIEANAFYKCNSLSGVFDLSSVTSIASGAFVDCARIEGFVLPNNNINSSTKTNIFAAFSNCPKIGEYHVTDKHPTYMSVDGVLYSKDGKTLLVYPKAKTDKIFTPIDSVTTIGKQAFNGTLYLEEVILGENVTTLVDESFFGASIVRAYIPDNIKAVPFDVFKNCTKLEWIVFGSGVQLIGSGVLAGTSSINLVIVKNDMASLPASNGETHYASDYKCTNHIYGYLDKAPLCDEYGYNRCIICDRYEYVSPTNHSGAILEVVKRSCTTDGYMIVDCFECGEEVKVVTDKTPGHISNGKIYAVTAGFKTPAFTYSTCTVCGEMFIVDYSANFHILGDINCDGVINFFDMSDLKAYCEDNSSVTIAETNADINGDRLINGDDLKMLTDYLFGNIEELPESKVQCTSHGKKSTIEIIKPTCETNGFRIRYCSSCGILTDEINSPSLDHTFDSSFVIDSSCNLEGQRISHCTTCNQEIVEVLKKAPHSHFWYSIAGQRGYEYSICDKCGTLESRTVDYSVFESLIKQVPKYYQQYYAPQTLNLVEPAVANFSIALTQAEVDENVKLLSSALANAQYMIYGAPTVFIEDAPSSKGNQSYQPTKIIVAYMDENGKTCVEAIDYNAEIKVRGNTTADHTSKLPFNIKFSSKVDLFDMGASKKYCLLSNLNDNTYIRNALAFELSYKLGLDYACKYKVVDVCANGKYYGSYLLTTAVDVGEDRVDIDKELDYLIEIEYSFTKDAEDCIYFENANGNNPTPIYGMRLLINEPEKADMSGASLSRLHRLLAHIEFAIYSGDWELIQQYVDVDSVAKYFILHEMLKEIDIFWDSTRFYIEDGKLHGGPAWDFDLSMVYNGGGGQGESSAHSNTNGWLCEGGVAGDSTTGVWASIEWKHNSDGSYRLWFCALYLESPEFVELVCQYVLEYNEALTSVYADIYDERGNLVEKNLIDSIIYDEENLASFDRNRNKFGTLRQDYLKNVETVRTWLQNRNKWMQEFYAEKLEQIQK